MNTFRSFCSGVNRPGATSVSVVAVPLPFAGMIGILPFTPTRIDGRTHAYLIYTTPSDADDCNDQQFRDPIDDELLIESRTFPTIEAARQWIDQRVDEERVSVQ